MIKIKNILYLFIFGTCIFPLTLNAQKKELTKEEKQHKIELEKEAKYLRFQSLFFEAISQKSRQDYTKAIESLEVCKAIYPEDAGLNFEFAKNYLELKDYDNAIFFAKKVFAKKSKNLAVLEFLKNAYALQFDYTNAIAIQNKLVALKPDKENDLIYLYIKNKQKDKARESYQRLEKLGLLDYRKVYFKNILFKQKSVSTKNLNKTETKTPKNNFLKIKDELNALWQAKDYQTLTKKNKEALEKYSAQPFLYLMQGRALVGLTKYKKAIQHLEFGLDFVLLDNKTLLTEFYKELKVAYELTGNTSKALKYQQKIDALKK